MLFKIKYFIPIALAITGLCGLVYITGQQNLRINANDPQIQLSEDIALSLEETKTSDLMPKNTVDIAKSLSPFVIVFDEDGKIVSSTGKLNGNSPELPKGVLSNTKANGQTRITWMPREDARIASVITHYNGGYVLVGRSLREVERREDQLFEETALAWAVIMGFVFFASLILTDKRK